MYVLGSRFTACNSSPHYKVQWIEYVGMKRRGDPSSLYLEERDAKQSKSTRKPTGGSCPPPYTREEFLDLARRKITTGAHQHTDGAQAYAVDLPGVVRDKVKHKKNEFTKPGAVPGTWAGTQSLDGWWGHAKKACVGVNAQAQNALSNHVHEAQWRHWTLQADKWLECGALLRLRLTS